MHGTLVIVLLFLVSVSGYRLIPGTTTRLRVGTSIKGQCLRPLYSTSETSEAEGVTEAPKVQLITEEATETKKVEEWRDPVAVAAEGKSPLADIFPGGNWSNRLTDRKKSFADHILFQLPGINGGNILGFFIYGYIGYLFLDSVRIMVMNYGVTPPPL